MLRFAEASQPVLALDHAQRKHRRRVAGIQGFAPKYPGHYSLLRAAKRHQNHPHLIFNLGPWAYAAPRIPFAEAYQCAWTYALALIQDSQRKHRRRVAGIRRAVFDPGHYQMVMVQGRPLEQEHRKAVDWAKRLSC
jgi:hypothetical protein